MALTSWHSCLCTSAPSALYTCAQLNCSSSSRFLLSPNSRQTSRSTASKNLHAMPSLGASQSGAPRDRTLSKWLALFIQETQLERIQMPDDVECGQRIRIGSCLGRDARQIWLTSKAAAFNRKWVNEKKEQIYNQLFERFGRNLDHPDNADTIFLFHGTCHSSARAIAIDGIKPLEGSPRNDFSHGSDRPPAPPNRGGFYLSRYMPAAIRWAMSNFPNEAAVLVYKVHRRAFSSPPVRSYDFFNNSTDTFWQSTVTYFRSGCATASPQLTETFRNAAPRSFVLGPDSFHCLIGPRSEEMLENGSRWNGWRTRAPYTWKALRDVFIKQEGCGDNNELYCIKAPIDTTHPEGNMELSQRLDSCLILVAYL